MPDVTVQFLKNPDILHWGFEGTILGEDEHGVWVAIPAGSRRWKGETVVRPTSSPAVFCVPEGEWWHLHYNGAFRENYSHFVDIVTPPVWVAPDRYEMIDLDLDVVRHVDGTIEIQDEDEFEDHQVRYGYTPQMIAEAVATTDRVASALRAGAEPYFDTAAAWLSKV